VPVDAPLLFRYRLAVARLGERDLFHWWESNALTEEGRYALGRLFRHTAIWAGMALAIEAAQARHEALVPPGARVTLFNLGPELEDSYESWLGRAKSDSGSEAIEIPMVPDAARSSVSDAMAALRLPTEEAKPKALGDRTIHVAQVTQAELEEDTDRILRVLLSAYRRSEKERFLAPYATLR
jgi:hypothetical protein